MFKIGRATGVDPARIFDDPANFLHSIDIDGDRAIFLRTSPELLRDASFVDGRNPIATAEPQPAPLSQMIHTVQQSSAIDRFLFNCSFCGSTLLARMLDVPGRSLVLKEPRCLTDIAGWKTFNLRDGLPIDRLRPLLQLARGALRRQFTPGELVSVKVACQGNVLLDALAEDSARIRPIFITISRLKFLLAIFRGGAGRMHHAATSAWHLATDIPEGDALLREATGAGADPLRKAANLALLARYLQVGAFQRAALAGGWNNHQVIDYEDISRAPREAASKAVRALGLEIDDNDIDRNVARIARRYSKQPHKVFSSDRQRLADEQLLAEHRQVFDDALAWAESRLGPQRAVVT